MEVAPPLTFARANQGNKRRYTCSPIHDTKASNVSSALDSADDFDMEEGSGFGYPVSKRRKMLSSEDIDSRTLFPQNDKWFLPSRSPSQALRSPNTAQASYRRSRASLAEAESPLSVAAHQKLEEFRRVVEQQATEIERLKAEKEASRVSMADFTTKHEKVENENRILKRAVAIQQDRQNHLTSELEGAKRFKIEADERIRRLEQMNLTLQYQLQALTPATGNDFMRFGQPPPGVY